MGDIEYTDQNGDSVKEFFSTRTPEQLEEERQLREDAKLAYRPGYITIPIEEWYTDERLNDGDILLLAFILGYLKNNKKLYMQTDKLCLIARKKTPDAVDKQLKKLHDLGFVKKTTRSLLGGGRQRVIAIPDETIKRTGRNDQMNASPAVQKNLSLISNTNLSNSSLVGTPKKERGEGPKRKYRDFVFLSDSELEQLVSRFGERDAQARIERLDDYIGSRGVKYASHYRTILVWAKKDAQTSVTLPSPQSLESKRKENEERIAKMREAGLFDREARFKKIREDAALENLKQQET
jgi:predicted transcriptional regulator